MDKMFLITLCSFLMTMIAVLVEIATPEMRCWLGLQSCIEGRTTFVMPHSLQTSTNSQIKLVNFYEVLNPEQGQFEKTSQYKTRRQQLLEDFNQTLLQPDLRYQAGTAYLKDYNPDREILWVHLDWQAEWAKQFLETFPQYGTLKIAPGDAKTLWRTGQKKSLFINIERIDNRFKGKGVLVEQGQHWFIHLMPIPEMVTIPAGQFQMGDLSGKGDIDEKPVQTITLKRFAMSRYEITFDEYDYFAEITGRTKPNDNGWGRGRRPVINVSWEDINAYIKWLNQLTGQTYRLPTEAEWEYAARAGTKTDYGWGEQIGLNQANCDGCQSQWDNKRTAPVGSFAPNRFGLYDIVGNVWEWTCSKYEEKYSGQEQQCNLQNPADLGVIRGGSWLSYIKNVRVTNRGKSELSYRQNYIGFRLVQELPKENIKTANIANNKQPVKMTKSSVFVSLSSIP
jgi:formylglycine-generating enzyme required for sulfatase activity